MLSKLQYISQGKTASEQSLNIQKALDHGADWIQLRWKEAAYREKMELSIAVRKMCASYHARCIINDHIDIAAAVDADGVHLGLNDETITTARVMLGTEKTIGGTANTLTDVLQRIEEQCDYIGLGPFRFTTTKEQLSPVLGLEGYTHILSYLQEQGIITPPLYAIGGIETTDIPALLQTGVQGIALSGLITREPELIPQLKNLLQ